ncbi:MAG: acetyl-CoA hydrolase/transferase C-terminal domain-containing protein [Candidatus Melainabacteria bacterium]|nr:acetyl-CoA hydrolase/transferase C-terminal domain-containing protein [Candidatus Melainabacteria bacterium]
MNSTVKRHESWIDDYQKKVVSAEQAVLQIRSGDCLYIHSNAAAPAPLIDALVQRAATLRDVEVYHILTMGPAPYIEPQYRDSFKLHALFIGKNVREAVNAGRANYTPVFLSEIPGLFLSGRLNVDVCLIQVSPPDSHGYCSYGVSVDCTIAARKRARLVIAEVNKQMPRTLGRSFVHVSKLDYIIETDRPIPTHQCKENDDVATEIGRNCASLVEDGATLQLGIGAIPDATLKFLFDKKDLGIHSEMFSDGVLDLVEAGVITNDCKTVLPGKIAVSFVMGSKRLYDFIDNNPLIEFQPSDFINDPNIIAQNYKMTAINSALQIDLTGQVCSDSVGEQLYSGFGGQVDFIRGAARSQGGRPIIAMPSTAKAGTVSRIVAHLSRGSGVVTSRGDVHYVVTEYGIADLYGKNLKSRARSLISIAHPSFRAELEKEASGVPWM